VGVVVGGFGSYLLATGADAGWPWRFSEMDGTVTS